MTSGWNICVLWIQYHGHRNTRLPAYVVLALHFILQRKVVAGITDQGRYPVARYLELDRSIVPDGPPSSCKTISRHDTTFYSI
jgi:hypothetical protein